MKITLISNFFNHHQKPLCDKLHEKLGDDFKFVSTIPMPDNFRISGYTDYSKITYNHLAYQSNGHYKEALLLAETSDIVIIGAASKVFIKNRLKANKHTFWYSERFFKKGKFQMWNPRIIKWLILDHFIYRNKNLYMLCASAYTANDLNWVWAYPNKKFKWGYFTKVPSLDLEKVISQKPKNKISILLVCRLIDWKHPDIALKMVERLKRTSSIPFELNLIGSGEMKNELKQYVIDNNLQDYVHFLGNIPNDLVLQKMKESNIFLFTSDRNEGWGAVLNEAMGSACAVICSHLIGAAPFLIKNRQNGLIFKSEDVEDLTRQVETLLNDETLRNKLSTNAYATMAQVWSPKQASENLILLCKSALHSSIHTPITEGPCSLAKPTSKKWYL